MKKEKERGRSQFEKRFSIGLSLKDDINVLSSFLDDYSLYIDNFYFSLPMGDKFHSRKAYKEYIRKESVINQFWESLRVISCHGLSLELLLNTEEISEEEIFQSRLLLDDYNIEVQKIGILDNYYESVRKFFPTQSLVYSFNNFPNSKDAIVHASDKYDEIVIGRQFIRDNELFCRIKQNGSSVVLLLNNGCSHICGGCKTFSHCHDAYFRQLLYSTPEQLYSLGSIFPSELRNSIGSDKISIFKIASRNADINYIRKCIDSYINDSEKEYIEKDKNNYMLWGRLQWHSDYFKEFEYDNIVRIKESNEFGFDKNRIYFEIDLSDYFTINNYIFTNEIYNNYSTQIKEKYHKLSVIDGVIFGCESCFSLLKKIDYDILLQNVMKAKELNLKVSFQFPMMDCSTLLRGESYLGKVEEEFFSWFDYFVVNDEYTLFYIERIIDKKRCILGRAFDRTSQKKRLTNRNMMNLSPDRERLLGKHFLSFTEKNEIQSIYVNLPEEGLFISRNEKISIKTNISERVVCYEPFCLYSDMGECQFQCLENKNKENFSKDDLGHRRMGRMIFENINAEHPNTISTLIENRMIFIYKPLEKFFK